MQYRLVVEYDGTDFCGWQLQPEQRTVQGALEQAAAQVVGHPVRMRAAGRTDAGVHAAGQVVAFAAEGSLAPAAIQRALNALTGPDLSIREADLVPDDFDPRRSARSRLYVYRIWNRPAASPFWRRYAWHVRRTLDLEAMAACARMLEGEHDFTSFRAAGCDAAHPVRFVLRSEVSRDGHLVRYDVQATAFLRHMVRNIVGTLVEVGCGARTPEEFSALLGARDRNLAGATAPPAGLCLAEIRY